MPFLLWLPLLDSPLNPRPACPPGLRRQPLLSLPGPGKRCTASFSLRGFESNLIGYSQTAAPPLWVALLFGSPCWTRTNDTPQFAIVALRRRKRLPCARCSLGFRLAPPRTAGARLRPVNSRDPADAQSRCPGQPAGDTKGKAPSWVPFLLWLPLLDSPLNPRPACPPGLRRQPLLSLPGPGKRCTASFSLRGFESNLIGYSQTAAPPLWVALLFGSPCWTRTNDTAVNSRMLYRLS